MNTKPTTGKAGSDTAAPGRRERKREQLADHLADTAWDMFQAFGFEAVSMEAIAEAADVAKATLYKHFAVKGALVAQRLHREMAEAAPHFRAELARLPDTRSRFRIYLQHSADWIDQHKALFAPYVRYRLQAMMDFTSAQARSVPGSGTSGAFASLLMHGQSIGDVRSDVSVDALANTFNALYLSTLTRWLLIPETDLRAEFELMTDLFFSGASPARRP